MDIEARLVELEARVTALSDEVARLRQRECAMRTQLACPACGGRRLLNVKRVLSDPSGTNPLALSFDRWGKAYGVLRCHVCVGCGVVEWHIASASRVPVDDKTVELIDNTDPAASGGPYR